MLREHVAPALRRAGFKGSGQRFELPSESVWRILGFQKSTASDASRVKFTVNVTVVDRAAWAQARLARTFLPERPSANVRQGVGWMSRIGKLMPRRDDHWWEIRADEPVEPRAAEVVSAITGYAVPAMEEHSGRSY